MPLKKDYPYMEQILIDKDKGMPQMHIFIMKI